MAATPTVKRTSAVLEIPTRKSSVAAFASSVLNSLTWQRVVPQSHGPPLARAAL